LWVLKHIIYHINSASRYINKWHLYLCCSLFKIKETNFSSHLHMEEGVLRWGQKHIVV
jgi:hypothetical protein